MLLICSRYNFAGYIQTENEGHFFLFQRPIVIGKGQGADTNLVYNDKPQADGCVVW